MGIIVNATSTIGNTTQTGGLTISGGATTTGNAYFAGNVGIGTTSPLTPLSVVQKTNGSNVLTIQRATDSGETGNLLQFLRANGTVASAFGADGQLAVGNSYIENYQNTWSRASSWLVYRFSKWKQSFDWY